MVTTVLGFKVLCLNSYVKVGSERVEYQGLSSDDESSPPGRDLVCHRKPRCGRRTTSDASHLGMSKKLQCNNVTVNLRVNLRVNLQSPKKVTPHKSYTILKRFKTVLFLLQMS